MYMSDDKADKEWNRIMDNPENVIMSEGLISKVDPYDLGEIEPNVHASADCEIIFSDYSIVGTIIGFHGIKGVVSYTALIPAAESFHLFNESPLQSFKVYSYNNTLFFKEYPEGVTFDFEVEVQDGENAILTVSFPVAAQ